jgi:hypothetical protein
VLADLALPAAASMKHLENQGQIGPAFDLPYFSVAIMLTLLGGVTAPANHLPKSISTLTAFSLGLSIPALTKVDANRSANKPTPGTRID